MKNTLFIFLCFAFSCTVTHTPKKVLDCDPHLPICEASKFAEVKFDTLSNQKVHFIVKKVESLSSNNNEYALSFYSNNNALLTLQNNKLQEMRHFKNISEDVFSEKELVPTVSGPNGIASVNKNKIYFTAEPNYIDENKMAKFQNEANNGDGKLRIPLSQMPGRLRLFEGKINEDKVSDIKILNTAYDLQDFDWEGHPAISPNGKLVFFASTRGNTYRDVDLFFGEINKDGNIENIKNLGDRINTPCDEFSPFISNDGKRLYFSSMGHESVGGYDLFYADIRDEFWNNLDTKFISNAINVGKPVNTEYDEMFPSSPENPKELLYYSSNQNRNDYDIYVLYKNERLKIELGSGLKLDHKEIKTDIDVKSAFKTPDPLPFENLEIVKKDTIAKKDTVIKKEKEYFQVKGEVKDEDNVPIVNADVKVKQQTGGLISFETRTDELGKYELSLERGIGYEITAQDRKHFYDSYYISKEESETLEKVEKEFILAKTFDLRINFPYNFFNKPYRNIIDKNGIETNKQWELELNDLATAIKKMMNKIDNIILTGHTDMQGSDSYNNTLGLNRAKFVASELIKRGIAKEKLKVQSKGKSEPFDKLSNEEQDIYDKKLRRVNLEIFENK